MLWFTASRGVDVSGGAAMAQSEQRLRDGEGMQVLGSENAAPRYHDTAPNLSSVR
jgi:hypothetical protein